MAPALITIRILFVIRGDISQPTIGLSRGPGVRLMQIIHILLCPLEFGKNFVIFDIF